jgi:hypothetical protein
MWPESVYGIVNPHWWVLLEHVSWAVFCVAFLILSCMRNTREMRAMALRTAQVDLLDENRFRDCSGLEACAEVANG